MLVNDEWYEEANESDYTQNASLKGNRLDESVENAYVRILNLYNIVCTTKALMKSVRNAEDGMPAL